MSFFYTNRGFLYSILNYRNGNNVINVRNIRVTRITLTTLSPNFVAYGTYFSYFLVCWFRQSVIAYRLILVHIFHTLFYELMITGFIFQKL